MLDLEFLKSSEYFEQIFLKKWEILFSEWERDEYVYIVYDGEISVEKSLQTQAGEFKNLGLLWIWNIIGEWSLDKVQKKEVQIKANRNSTLLRIHGKEDVPKFIESSPKEAYIFLMTIINLANTRLLRANRELSANYEVSQAILWINTINMKSIIALLQSFQSILWVDRIIYFEKNIAVDTYYKLRYDSQANASLTSDIFVLTEDTLFREELESQWLTLSRYVIHTPLLLWKKNYGYLVVGKNGKDFHENEEKLLGNTAASFVWVIHQKEILNNERNKTYIKSV